MEFLGAAWNAIINDPMANGLLVLYVLLFKNLGLAIIAFTVSVRLLTYPLVVRQLRATRRMQTLQPRMKQIQERYKNDSQRRGQEMMRLYKEEGVNPIGCMGPLIIQMPIFIGLFWAINNVVPFTPENLAGLSARLYSWLPMLNTVIPVDRSFLGMDLALEASRAPGVLSLSMVALSGITMYIQQKMAQVPSTDPQQQTTQRITTVMLPLMFGGFSLVFPMGLVIYWVASNVIGIIIQYFVSGTGSLKRPRLATLGPSLAATPPAEEESTDGGEGKPRTERQDRGRGDRARDARARRRPRGGRNRRH